MWKSWWLEEYGVWRIGIRTCAISKVLPRIFDRFRGFDWFFYFLKTSISDGGYTWTCLGTRFVGGWCTRRSERRGSCSCTCECGVCFANRVWSNTDWSVWMDRPSWGIDDLGQSLWWWWSTTSKRGSAPNPEDPVTQCGSGQHFRGKGARKRLRLNLCNYENKMRDSFELRWRIH